MMKHYPSSVKCAVLILTVRGAFVFWGRLDHIVRNPFTSTVTFPEIKDKFVTQKSRKHESVATQKSHTCHN